MISPKPKKPAYIIALQQFRGGATAGKRVIPHGLDMQFENLRIAILPNLSGEPLLGMDVLGQLRVTQNAGILKLQAQ